MAATKFYEELKRFQEERGITSCNTLNLQHCSILSLISSGVTYTNRPSLAQRDLNLYKLYRLVRDNGGMEKVSQELKWRSLYMQLGLPPLANSSYMIKQAYKKWAIIRKNQKQIVLVRVTEFYVFGARITIDFQCSKWANAILAEYSGTSK